MMTDKFRIISGDESRWDEVAALIYDSLNTWFREKRGFTWMTGDSSPARLFPETYAALDGAENLILAEDVQSGRLAASCFFHPRKTHASLGILNVHPDFFGQGAGSRVLARIIEMAQELNLPLRLVSEAGNLESYPLYNRVGFVPYAIFQDMMIPKFSPTSVEIPPSVLGELQMARPATREDVPAMVALERELYSIERPGDYEYFIQNKNGAWNTWVLESLDGRIDGFLSSIDHPASRMLGPGIMRTQSQMLALIFTALSHFTQAPLFLVPPECTEALRVLYSWGARNTAVHLGQCLGSVTPPTGIVMPTFMPETA